MSIVMSAPVYLPPDKRWWTETNIHLLRQHLALDPVTGNVKTL